MQNGFIITEKPCLQPDGANGVLVKGAVYAANHVSLGATALRGNADMLTFHCDGVCLSIPTDCIESIELQAPGTTVRCVYPCPISEEEAQRSADVAAYKAQYGVPPYAKTAAQAAAHAAAQAAAQLALQNASNNPNQFGQFGYGNNPPGFQGQQGFQNPYNPNQPTHFSGNNAPYGRPSNQGYGQQGQGNQGYGYGRGGNRPGNYPGSVTPNNPNPQVQPNQGGQWVQGNQGHAHAPTPPTMTPEQLQLWQSQQTQQGQQQGPLTPPLAPAGLRSHPVSNPLSNP